MHLINLLALMVISFWGCASSISGRINTAHYAQAPGRPSFTVIFSRQLTLTDRRIIEQIEQRMVKAGFEKTAPAEANVAVLYGYSLGAGSSVVSSSPDVVFGGQSVSSYVTYPRMFEIALIDLERSQLPDKVEIIWQGELRSSGSINDMSLLAPVFLDALFDRYGKTVSNDSFSTVAPW